MVSALVALDSEASGPGSSPGRGHSVLLQDTLLSQCLSPPSCINGYRRIQNVDGTLIPTADMTKTK